MSVPFNRELETYCKSLIDMTDVVTCQRYDFGSEMGNDEKFFLEYFFPIMDRNRTSDCVRRAFRIKSASPRSQIVLKKHFINETTATVAVEK